MRKKKTVKASWVMSMLLGWLLTVSQVKFWKGECQKKGKEVMSRSAFWFSGKPGHIDRFAFRTILLSLIHPWGNPCRDYQEIHPWRAMSIDSQLVLFLSREYFKRDWGLRKEIHVCDKRWICTKEYRFPGPAFRFICDVIEEYVERPGKEPAKLQQINKWAYLPTHIFGRFNLSYRYKLKRTNLRHHLLLVCG